MEFVDWLEVRDITASTKQTYRSSLTRFFESTTINKPMDIRKIKLKDKESRGLRNLLNYCEDAEIECIAGYGIEKWRRFIKIRKSGVVEIYVTNEEIVEAYNSCPEDLKTIYQLLAYSGSRLTHIHKMLHSFDEKNIIIDGDVAYYPTASFSEGTKNTFQVFSPVSFIPKLKTISQLKGYETIMKGIRHDRVSAKTIRKWHLNVMIREGVTESIADFIQGRASLTVGSAHYLNKVGQAKNEFKKLIDVFPI
ncbi:integrase [Methanococcoides seepicolus]|uniref:Integrase SSV1 C-terminal domain-containing protein n=1 Tax=Methanococcoides seepicolus TaxID=2828780 RepID=A0A9E5DCA9_9EURY|nr:integrase [Methanococcoides seepicolus]MCM1987896.1 hypothetical protein [Methanococcoides seepicolus]